MRPYRNSVRKQRLNVSIITVLTTVVILICPGFVRAYSVILSFALSYIFLFAAIYYLLLSNKTNKELVVVSSISTLLAVLIFLLIKSGSKNFGIPTLSGLIISCLSAYFYVKSAGKLLKAFVITLFSGIGVFYVVVGFECWMNYQNFGSFFKYKNKNLIKNWNHYIDGDSLMSNTKNKIVLLDFFNTRCAVCVSKFPSLQEIYLEYKNNPNVIIFAVDVPFKDDTAGIALKFVRTRNFIFPVVIGTKKIDSVFEIRSYPTTIILKNDTEIFKGNIETARNILSEEVQKI